jgi:pSer/pThr/pTyr-binding forkhead associated (FHA) protein
MKAKRKKALWHCTTLLLLMILGLSLGPLARAQEPSVLIIDDVDTSGFPTVRAYVTVAGLERQPVLNLEAANFELYENDIQQQIGQVVTSTQDMLLTIVIDSASSLLRKEGAKTQLEHARDASIQLVAPENGHLTAGDRVAVYAFQDGQPLQLVDFTTDHNLAIDQGLYQVTTKGNTYTGLFDIVKLAVEATAGIPAARRRAILVFSDGWDSTSGSKIDQVVQLARQEHVLIFTVGLGSGMAPDKERSQFLRFLADSTDGRYLWYRPAAKGGQQAMADFLQTIAAYKTMYEIGYESSLYKGEPALHIVARYQDREASGRRTFPVPVLPPKIALETPQNGQVLQGSVEVRAAPYQLQRDVDRVEFYVDGQLIHTARQEPYSLQWDTTAMATDYLSPTIHNLQAIVYDIGGYQAEQSVTIGLLAIPPTPTPTPVPPTATPVPTPTPQPTTAVVAPFTTENDLSQQWLTPQSIISLASLVVALIAVVLVVIMIRRGPPLAVQNFAQEVKRRTLIFGQRTGILAGGSISSRGVLATLTVQSDMFKNKQFDMAQNVIFLGREEERSDVAFYWDNYISRRHAKISREGDDFYIWDLNSANGTWVDGQRLPKSTSEGMDLDEAVRLEHGSLIQLGPDLKVQFALTQARPASRSPATIQPEDNKPPVFSPEAMQAQETDGQEAAPWQAPAIGTPIPLYRATEPAEEPDETPTQVMGRREGDQV